MGRVPADEGLGRAGGGWALGGTIPASWTCLANTVCSGLALVWPRAPPQKTLSGPPSQVYHELVVLEKINQTPEFSPGATLEAVTRPPLELG